jgi:hypothetical protein
MILLVTPSERAPECGAALREAIGEEFVIAEDLVQATARLRAQCYLAVVVDQYLLESEPDEAANTMGHLGTAILVQVNPAISGMDRLVREVRAAVKRRRREEVAARQAVGGRLQSEFSGTITALLLSTELAMETPDLPSAAADKLGSILTLVQQLRRQLESAFQTEEPEALRS